VRRAIDKAGHPALLLVDTISSLGSIDYRHDEWSVHVTIGGSQMGLMLPPGLSFNAISDKALVASNGHSADALRAEIVAHCNMSLGNGPGPLADRVFRIGHRGDFHDIMVTGTLSGAEIGLKVREHRPRRHRRRPAPRFVPRNTALGNRRARSALLAAAEIKKPSEPTQRVRGV